MLTQNFGAEDSLSRDVAIRQLPLLCVYLFFSVDVGGPLNHILTRVILSSSILTHIGCSKQCIPRSDAVHKNDEYKERLKKAPPPPPVLFNLPF